MTTDNLNTESDVEIDTLQDEAATLRARLATVERERDEALRAMDCPGAAIADCLCAHCRDYRAALAERDTLRAQLERAREAWRKLRPLLGRDAQFPALDAALAEPAPEATASLPTPSTVECNDKLPTNSAAPAPQAAPESYFREAPQTKIAPDVFEVTKTEAPTSGPGEAPPKITQEQVRESLKRGAEEARHMAKHIAPVFQQPGTLAAPGAAKPAMKKVGYPGHDCHARGLICALCEREGYAPQAKPAEPEEGRRRVDQLAHVVMWWLHSMDEEALRSTEAALERINLTHSRYLDCYLRDGLLAAVGDQLRALAGKGTKP